MAWRTKTALRNKVIDVLVSAGLKVQEYPSSFAAGVFESDECSVVFGETAHSKDHCRISERASAPIALLTMTPTSMGDMINKVNECIRAINLSGCQHIFNAGATNGMITCKLCHASFPVEV